MKVSVKVFIEGAERRTYICEDIRALSNLKKNLPIVYKGKVLVYEIEEVLC